MKRKKLPLHSDPDYVVHMTRNDKRRAGIVPGNRPEKAHPKMRQHIENMADKQTRASNNLSLALAHKYTQRIVLKVNGKPTGKIKFVKHKDYEKVK